MIEDHGADNINSDDDYDLDIDDDNGHDHDEVVAVQGLIKLTRDMDDDENIDIDEFNKRRKIGVDSVDCYFDDTHQLLHSHFDHQVVEEDIEPVLNMIDPDLYAPMEVGEFSLVTNDDDIFVIDYEIDIHFTDGDLFLPDTRTEVEKLFDACKVKFWESYERLHGYPLFV